MTCIVYVLKVYRSIEESIQKLWWPRNRKICCHPSSINDNLIISILLVRGIVLVSKTVDSGGVHRLGGEG